MRRRTSCSRGLERRAPGLGAQADLGGQAGLHLGGEDDLAAGHGGDRVADALAGRRLGEIGADPARDRLVDGVAVEVRAEQDDAGGQAVAAQRIDDVDPAQGGHLDVEDGDVGTVGADRLERLAPVAGLPHELELGARADRADDRLAIEGMVVGHEDRRALRAAVGHGLPRRNPTGGRRAGPWRRCRRAPGPCSRSPRRRRRGRPARCRSSSEALTISTLHRGGGSRSRRRSSTSRPSMSGIRRSSSTTSGRRRSIASSAASPPSASPTSSRPVWTRTARPMPRLNTGTVVDDQDADGAGAADRFRS